MFRPVWFRFYKFLIWYGFLSDGYNDEDQEVEYELVEKDGKTSAENLK